MRTIRIDAASCLWWAVLLMLLPLRWLIAATTAALFHELCHYAAIRAMGRPVEGVLIRPSGAVLKTPPLKPIQELFCALAGPMGSLFLLFFFRWIPLTALCGLIQALYNLLPVYPLDGGRVLHCIFLLLLPNKAPDNLCRTVSLVTVTLVTAAALAVSWHFSLGFGVLFPLAILINKIIPGKRPCKTTALALQ